MKAIAVSRETTLPGILAARRSVSEVRPAGSQSQHQAAGEEREGGLVVAGGEELGLEELQKALHNGVCTGQIIPVVCNAAAPNIGVQPMLAGTAASVSEALALTGPASVEWKLDGARIQVHRRGDDVRVFTRSLNEIGSRVPSIVDAVLALPTPELVLDGESFHTILHDRPDAALAVLRGVMKRMREKE